MIVVGLAGGIGCGKSEVARIMADLGAFVIDADKYGHQVYAPNTEGWKEVVAAFGEDILDENGEVDRRKLGPKVFGKPEEMEKLNNIAWPKIKHSIQEEINNQRQVGTGVVVVDAAILIEAGWTDLSDQVWVATAPEAQVIKRVQARNNITEEQVKARIASQMSTDERVSYADVVVSNDQDLDSLKDSVTALWAEHLGEK